MPLTTSNQKLFVALDGHAATLESTTLEIIEVAKRINDAGFSGDAMSLMEASRTLRGQYESIIEIADEVQDGLIFRRDL
ncbi:hypothetical protein JBE38_13595 [Pseudomonas sp. ICBG1301]|uniref:hypothetical protein n=1 Tax=Pseudomonas sp. ICBG1301 TaxID=2795987 RepID=UPI000F87C5E8|nr:hypothetical protein [Pseudomonas sp. ICBG1301]MBM9486960.1 hypothetical protein [Pseudomonas sp. ICBG1301]RUQ46592.1 hypothetical protein D8M30_12715 [Corynebacterium pseudodiphtheriticum]